MILRCQYPPIKVIKSYPSNDPQDERAETIRMLGDYGIDNVRGAEFTEITLPEEVLFILVLFKSLFEAIF